MRRLRGWRLAGLGARVGLEGYIAARLGSGDDAGELHMGPGETSTGEAAGASSWAVGRGSPGRVREPTCLALAHACSPSQVTTPAPSGLAATVTPCTRHMCTSRGWRSGAAGRGMELSGLRSRGSVLLRRHAGRQAGTQAGRQARSRQAGRRAGRQAIQQAGPAAAPGRQGGSRPAARQVGRKARPPSM